MSSAAHGTGRRRGGDETRKERVDRELMELLNELRVALPGVQFLFAFLLIVPVPADGRHLTSSSATSTSSPWSRPRSPPPC